jgi:hypothetical protein
MRQQQLIATLFDVRGAHQHKLYWQRRLAKAQVGKKLNPPYKKQGDQQTPKRTEPAPN